MWYKFSQLQTPLKLPDGSLYIPKQSAIKNPAAVQQLTGFTYDQLPIFNGATPPPVMQPTQTTNQVISPRLYEKPNTTEPSTQNLTQLTQPPPAGAAPTPVMQPTQTTNKSTALEPQKRETVPMNSNFIPSDAQIQNASKQMQTEMFGRANQFGPTAQELKRYLEGKPSVPGGLGSGQLVVEK